MHKISFFLFLEKKTANFIKKNGLYQSELYIKTVVTSIQKNLEPLSQSSQIISNFVASKSPLLHLNHPPNIFGKKTSLI